MAAPPPWESAATMSFKIIADNRKARFNYEILESFEAGLALVGTEVKSIRANRLNLNESYALIRHNELFLLNAHIPLYTFGNINNHEPFRTRKLLVHAHEIRRLIGYTQQKGLSLIPLKAYWSGSRVKIEVGIGRGKKLYDKRETKKEQDWNREKERYLKQG